MSTRSKIDLENVIVHPRKDWPRPFTHGYGGRDVRIPQGRDLHTTQRFVSPSLVDDKITAIQAGERLRVSLARDSLGRFWITDGHHTIAAYRTLNQTPRGFLYDVGGEVSIDPPRYQGKM